MTAKMHDKIYAELIMRACKPSRMFQWHESACDEYREEYLSKCAEYRIK